MTTKVRLKKVLKLCDPRSDWPWDCQAPDKMELQRLIVEAEERAGPIEGSGNATEHIGRVRYLAKQGWKEPIDIDVGIPILGYPGPDWPVTDGNHRLWAAALRGDTYIEVEIAGQVDHAAKLLGVAEAAITGERTEA